MSIAETKATVATMKEMVNAMWLLCLPFLCSCRAYLKKSPAIYPMGQQMNTDKAT